MAQDDGSPDLNVKTLTGPKHDCHIYHQSLGVGPPVLLLQSPARGLKVPNSSLDLGTGVVSTLPPAQIRAAGSLSL